MIAFGADFILTRLLESPSSGVIVRFYDRGLTTGGAMKYSVVLNQRWPPRDEPLVVCRTTSRVENQMKRWPQEILVLQPDLYACFPKRTAIQVRDAEIRDPSEFCGASQFSFEGVLSAEHLEQVRLIARGCGKIPAEVLRLIDSSAPPPELPAIFRR